jgi:hypothetical protein
MIITFEKRIVVFGKNIEYFLFIHLSLSLSLCVTMVMRKLLVVGFSWFWVSALLGIRVTVVGCLSGCWAFEVVWYRL